MTTSFLLKNLEFCIDECEMTDEQTGEMLDATEMLGLKSVEYFCEEFIFLAEPEEIKRYHDSDYLKIKWSMD